MPRNPPTQEAPAPKAIADQARAIIWRLLDELDASTAHHGELRALILAETASDPDGPRRQAMLRAIGLPSRAVVVKNLTAALRALDTEEPGKKGRAQTAARSAATGRFATPAAPRLVIDNAE